MEVLINDIPPLLEKGIGLPAFKHQRTMTNHKVVPPVDKKTLFNIHQHTSTIQQTKPGKITMVSE